MKRILSADNTTRFMRLFRTGTAFRVDGPAVIEILEAREPRTRPGRKGEGTVMVRIHADRETDILKVAPPNGMKALDVHHIISLY